MLYSSFVEAQVFPDEPNRWVRVGGPAGRIEERLTVVVYHLQKSILPSAFAMARSESVPALTWDLKYEDSWGPVNWMGYTRPTISYRELQVDQKNVVPFCHEMEVRDGMAVGGRRERRAQTDDPGHRSSHK